LALALLAGRHFSSRRFRAAAPVAPVPVIPEGVETPVEDITSVEKETVSQPAKPAPEEVNEENGGKEEASSHPEWFKNMLALHEKYYPSWQSGRSVSPPSSLSGQAASSSPSPLGVSPVGTAGVSSTPRGGRPGRISMRRNPATGSRTASAGGDTAAASGFESVTGAAVPYNPSDGGDTTPPDEGNGNTPPSDDDGNDEEEPPQQETVSIARTISSPGNTVSLVIAVNAEINGLIISEKLPSGYSIKAASPNYSKRRGNEYQWLLYGMSVQSQTITYNVEGSGGGAITGTYRSTKGSGTISGSSSLQ